jgi:peptide/nickel transport system substrate-binding protein
VGLAAACAPPRGAEREGTVFYASGAELQSINPLFTVHPLAKAIEQHALLLTLAVYDSTLTAVPRLAAAWEWARGRSVLTLHLRPDVRWHDGRATTAEDVAWTLRMAREPAVAYPRARDLAAIIAIETPDRVTVRLRFERPQPAFPDVLTDLAILPSHRFAGLAPDGLRRAEFNRRPLGNGPFRFVDHEANQRWVFERNPDLPEALGLPSIERFVLAIVNEPSTKLAALTSGELDVAGIAPPHASFVAADPRLQVVDYPTLLSYALVWNLRRAPFDDPRVRRALTLALDRPAIVDAYLYGFGRIAHGPVPPEHPWYDSVPPVPHDSAEAARLFDEAGWRRGADGVRVHGGRRLAFDLLTVGTGDNALEQMLQAQLALAGARVTLRTLELSSFLAAAQGESRDWDALVTGIPGDLSLSYVAAMFDGRTPGPLAYPGYRSAAFDAALDRVGAAPSEPALGAAWREAQEVLARDLPTTWLYHARGLAGMNRRVLASPPDLRGELWDIASWTIASTGSR